MPDRLQADRDAKPPAAPVLTLDLAGFALGGTPVLGAIALHIQRGETVALVGPSGIGKTTLLRIIAGLQQGFDGTCATTKNTAMVFQEPALLPWRSALDNICIPTGVAPEVADPALRDVGLTGRGSDFPGQFSLGQQRRLALARAFASGPELLLLDEPFVSLDTERVAEMMQLFAELRARSHVATLLVTHAREEAEQLCSRIITLGGSPATLVSDRQNSGAYFHSSASGVTSLGS